VIPHIPHEELLFLEDPQMDFFSQYIHFLSAWVLCFDKKLKNVLLLPISSQPSCLGQSSKALLYRAKLGWELVGNSSLSKVKAIISYELCFQLQQRRLSFVKFISELSLIGIIMIYSIFVYYYSFTHEGSSGTY
jgi:hypothetical protein